MKTLQKVWTPQGIQAGVPNGYAQKGESLWNPSTNDIQYIDEGKEGVDDQPVNVDDETFIPSNRLGFDKLLEPHMKHISKIQDKMKNREKNYKYSSLSKATRQLQDKQIDEYVKQNIEPVANLQKALHEQEVVSYNCGKLPKFDNGQNLLGIDPFVRLAPTVAGLTAGLGQFGHWAGNKIRYNNTYAENPYQQIGLNGLNQLRQNPYPAIRAAYDAESRNAYNMQNAGGLTGAQRYYGMIGNAIANQRGIADIYANTEAQNNALRSQYYNSLLKEGNEIATRRQNAAQHDWSDYVAAHGRKTKGIETGIANLINSINGGFQNEFKYRMGNKTLGMYLQQLDIDRIKALADYEKNLRQPSS